jgi:hypothetical protein
MADKMPLDEDAMTLILGLGDPEKPGQHGRRMIPAPENSAIDVITQIRDLCEDFLQTVGKEEESEDKEEGGKEPSEETEEE